jgi:uridine kinase
MKRIPDKYKVDPNKVHFLIIEGQFIFHVEAIRDLLDYKLFVETDDDIRLARMLLKENIYLKDKAPAMKSFFTIYEDYIKPCYIRYIEPTKKHAHLILPNFSFNSSLEIVETTILDFMVLNFHALTKANK